MATSKTERSPTLSELEKAKLDQKTRLSSSPKKKKSKVKNSITEIARETECKKRQGNYSRSYINDLTSELSEENVRVVCRFRPINKKERHEEKSQRLIDLPIEYSKDNDSVIIHREHYKNNLEFTLDQFLQSNTTQDDAFRLLGQPLVEQVMTGYNCTIFAYGQTGSGMFFLFSFIIFVCVCVFCCFDAIFDHSRVFFVVFCFCVCVFGNEFCNILDVILELLFFR